MTVKEVQNVEGVTGTYTRNYISRDMFKEVTTEYNRNTMDLGKYLKRRLDNAKDITKVFRNLEKEGYTITTVETSFMKVPCFNTEIGGVFNGNAHVVNVIWVDKQDYIDRGWCVPTSYKQTIFTVIY